MNKFKEIPDFSQAKVLVVGDLMLDRYWSGSTERISPEAPIPVVKVTGREDRVGGAGNVALNIASLGAKVSLLAITGDDEAANILQSKLQAAEVHTTLVRDASIPTVTKLRVTSRHHQMIRLDFEEALLAKESLEQLKQNFVRLLETEQFKVVVFSDYAKGCLTEVASLIQLCRQKNILCLVDPKGTDFSKYAGANLLTPNRSEFDAVCGRAHDEAGIQQAAASLMSKFDLQALLLTRSEEGMTLFEKNTATSQHFPASASEVFDVTGAGDTVIATLAACLSARSTLEQAVYIANRAAGIVVGKSGTAAIALHELELALNHQGSQNGILALNHLQALVRAAQAKKQTVVMTNGCFDIIHAGHIAYLEEAKRLGDKLIVAVNSDDSVKRLKGAARPINTLERRMQVLAGLQAVDWVIAFTEDTPADLVANVLPDILVKGGDWKVEEIAGGEAVVKNGGKVMSLSFKEGHSTTAIIDLIKEREQTR